MRRQRLLLFLSAVVSVALWTYACGDGTTEPPAPDPLLPTAVTVSPATATVVESDTLRLTATATNAYGQVVNGVEFVWASGNTAVAVVDASGLVTGVGAGEVQVTATAAGLTGRAELTIVVPVPTTIAVTPDSVVLIGLGQTTQLTAEVRDQAGRAMDGVPVAWSSADTTVAVVDSSGLVGAVGGGAVTVTARAGEASGDAYVAVNADRSTLVALYNATDGPNWVDNTNWLTDAPLGEWYGVSTDGRGRVVRLDLRGESVPHGLRGELPPELGGLANLNVLDLRNNDLSGAIPPELGGLAYLNVLDLRYNDLSGAIPPELGDLANLGSLDLGRNALTGAIPPELRNLANLGSLGLAVNALTGAIPPELGDLANLADLWLGAKPVGADSAGAGGPRQPLGNELSGAIPPELGNLANLERLGLHQNALTGPIPPELGDLQNLLRLYLGNNDLSGPVPPELGNLANLQILQLSSNDLTGAIPRELIGLPLWSFHWHETDLCAPADQEFQDWLRSISDHRRGVNCSSGNTGGAGDGSLLELPSPKGPLVFAPPHRPLMGVRFWIAQSVRFSVAVDWPRSLRGT